MKISKNAEILHKREELVDGMTGYMIECATNSEFDAPYTQADIDRCSLILDGFLTALDGAGEPAGPDAILEIVKRAVLALNELNDECDGSLIETDQREQLCDIIILAANNAGLDTGDDITEAWREW